MDTRNIPAKRPIWQFIVGGIAVLLVLCCALGAILNHSGGTTATNTTSHPQAATTKSSAATATATVAQTWKTIATFSGNGTKNTAQTAVPTHWRIEWSCNTASFVTGSYNVIISVLNEDATPYSLGTGDVNSMCQSGNTSGSSEEHSTSKATVYFNVISEGDWTINIQTLQ